LSEDQRSEERKIVYAVVEVTEGYKTYHAVCGNISNGGCMLKVNHVIPSHTLLAIKVYGKDKQGSVIVYDPFQVEVRNSRQNKKDPKIYYSGVQFKQKIKMEHGILQTLYPEKFT